MLVALDRNQREAWVVLRRLVNRGEVPTVPTAAAAVGVGAALATANVSDFPMSKLRVEAWASAP